MFCIVITYYNPKVTTYLGVALGLVVVSIDVVIPATVRVKGGRGRGSSLAGGFILLLPDDPFGTGCGVDGGSFPPLFLYRRVFRVYLILFDILDPVLLDFLCPLVFLVRLPPYVVVLD